jgi:hypothetical protein
VRLPPPKVAETNETLAEISLKQCARYAVAPTLGQFEARLDRWETPVNTIALLAFCSAALLAFCSALLLAAALTFGAI